MAKVVKQPADGQDVWVAIDISRSKWVFNVRWAGQEQQRLSTPGRIEHLHRLMARYASCRRHVAYEACGFGYEIAWWCEQHGIEVTVGPPSTIEKAPGAFVKTDRLDAAALNRKHEKAELKKVYVPRRREHERRQVSRTYAQMLADRKREQVRLRSLMQEYGRLGPEPKAGWMLYERWLSGQKLAAPVALCVTQLRQARAQAAAATRALKRALHELAALPEYRPVVDTLRQQHGVSWFTAIRLILEIGDITRFTTADSFAHFLGLTPSQYSSGELVHRGHLLKCGPGFVRAWLIQCAWAAIGGQGADPQLRACFERIATRAGKKRAIVAVARRLALRLRARWIEQLAALDHSAAA